MASEQVAAGPVELRYVLTEDDLLDGITAQRRGVGRRWVVAVLAIAPLVGLAIGLVRAEVWEMSANAALIIAVVSLVLLLVGVGVSLVLYWLLHRFLSRLVYRWQARLILRGNPWLSQPVCTTVTDSGVRAGNATGESRWFWSSFPLYAETDRSFVLLASKGLGAMALVLPKRGLGEEDATRLRALLDTHSHRRI